MSEWLNVLVGDCRETLKSVSNKSVQCCVTSPPYWGLRDYGYDGQIGIEDTPEQCVEALVEVFREVHRVLKDDGTVWVNVGDCYCNHSVPGGNSDYINHRYNGNLRLNKAPGYKPKDLIGFPWMVAFALRADGWYLRQDIIWHKPNPMPESCKDRCTKAHEYMFLLTKSKQYFYNQDAIKEPVSGNAHSRGNGVNPKSKGYKMPEGWDTSKGEGGHGQFHKNGREKGLPESYNGSSFTKGKTALNGNRKGVGKGDRKTHVRKTKQNESFSSSCNDLVEIRNKRSVWTIPSQGFKGAHFATYPEKLIEPCILAGSKPGDVILDPFAGSGTTGKVALENGRKAVLCEMNPEYVKLIKERCKTTLGLAI